MINEEGEGGAQQREKEEDCYANAITHMQSHGHTGRARTVLQYYTAKYHFSAFQHNCSCRILSLAIAGYDLSDEELDQYMTFATF